MLGSPWSGVLFGAIAGLAIAFSPDNDDSDTTTKGQP